MDTRISEATITLWAGRGFTLEIEAVARQNNAQGPKIEIGKAVIPVPNDLAKVTTEYGEGCVLGIMDGTSIRVMAQDVNRTGIAKGLSLEAILVRIDARLRGIRNTPVGGAARVVEVKVYTLPNGQQYRGTDLAEYQSLYTAALVDAGIDASVALTLAKQQTL